MNFSKLMIISSVVFIISCGDTILEKDYEYYSNGAVKREMTYKGNKFHMSLVKMVNFYNASKANKPLQISELNYENGLLNGEQKYWYKNGRKKMVLNYRYGLMHGDQFGWYDNGKNKFQQNYNFGNLDGAQFTYNKYGSLDREKLYKNGKLIRIIKD